MFQLVRRIYGRLRRCAYLCSFFTSNILVRALNLVEASILVSLSTLQVGIGSDISHRHSLIIYDLGNHIWSLLAPLKHYQNHSSILLKVISDHF